MCISTYVSRACHTGQSACPAKAVLRETAHRPSLAANSSRCCLAPAVALARKVTISLSLSASHRQLLPSRSLRA